MASDDVAVFGEKVAQRLAAALDGGLVGAYFVGSAALGGYVAGESDLDIVAVCDAPVPAELRPRIADALLPVTDGCPARGMELTLYRRQVAASPPAGADFELNVNGGPRMARSVHIDEAEEPGFWYVLDWAVAHRFGVVIVGPPPGQVFADVTRDALLVAMRDSMRWHRAHEGATLYSVLNACRAWRFATEDVMGSKLEGAEWAKARWHDPRLIDSAVVLRHGVAAELGPEQVDELLDHVEKTLSESITKPK